MTAGSNAAFTAYSPVVDAQSEDLNGDGIPDAWQRHYFSDGGPDTAADEDWDKDGAANRAEYIAGTDPTNSASFLHIEAVSPLSPAASVCFLSSSGRLYTLEWRTSLTSGAWSDLTGRTNLPGDGAMMWLTDTNPGPAKFLRLRVRTP
jgi:hypothetical protein